MISILFIQTSATKIDEKPCFSSCPPWEEMCIMRCADKPWYENPSIIRKAKEDTKIQALFDKYLKEERGRMVRFKSSKNEHKCYRACPPFMKNCTKRCMSKPWILQEKWTQKMKADPKFAEKAMSSIHVMAETNEENSKTACFPACPPWFEICTMQCEEKPWFLQNRWINKMKEDPEFRAKANAQMKKAPFEIEQED